METSIQIPVQWIAPANQKFTARFWYKWKAFTDGQVNNSTLWFLVSLMVQGILFLPIPAALIYYFNAPVLILPITLLLYFANIIAGMSGYGVRVILSIFMLSLIIHLSMVAIFTI